MAGQPHIAVDRGLLHFDSAAGEPPVPLLGQPECRIKKEAEVGRPHHLEAGIAHQIGQIAETITTVVQQPLVVNIV